MFFILIFLNLSKHKELCDTRKLTLTISHGQADVERVFSLNKNREIGNVNYDIMSKVKDHLITNKTMLNEFKVPSKMLQYAQSARHKYEV